MKSVRLAPVLLAALLLLCSACSPIAEVSPASTPVPSPSAEPTQAATPTPEPTPEPSPHDWAGSGYSYTSEKLGVTLEFPPEWVELMTISESKKRVELLADDGSEATESVDCVQLKPIHGWDADDGMSEDAIALIYWRYPDQRGPEAEYGDSVILGERDGKLCVCFLITNNKLNFVQEENPVIWNEYVTVEQGILNGEYEVKLLD